MYVRPLSHLAPLPAPWVSCILRDASPENLCIPFPGQSRPGAAFWGSWRHQVFSAPFFPTNTASGMAESNLGRVAAAWLVIVAFRVCVTH